MERVVVNRSFTLYKTFYADGVATDPTGTPTVAITRASTGAAVTTGAVTNEVAAGTWSVTVAATQNTLLDTLTVTWAATVNATPQQYVDTVEVAGGTLFNIDELAAELTTSTTTYTAAQITAARTYAETELETACGMAFVPRYALERIDGSGTRSLLLRPYVHRIRSVTSDDTAWSVDDLAAVSIGTLGSLYSASRVWTAGYSNLLVGYEHGFGYAPPGASEAALVLAKHKLVKGPIDERATQRPSEFGPVNLATPGMSGARFGIPVVDAFVVANNMNTGVA